MDHHRFRKPVQRLIISIGVLCTAILIVITGLMLVKYDAFPEFKVTPKASFKNSYEILTEVSALGNTPQELEIKLGFDIFQNSSKYIGPAGKKSQPVYAGNNLACANCHLLGGTKPYAAPLIGVVARFPQYRGREDKIGTIAERVNGCMERSMNGVALDSTGKEMKALISYMTWLGKYAADKGEYKGQGFLPLEIPDRAVNLEKGQSIFERNCAVCHGADGQGQMRKDSLRYTYPPLWGPDSYNNRAGMTRVITAAQFIKANMPFGVTFDQPLLSDEDCYDVAGYINKQQRPEKQHLEKDFPNLKKKPVSTPYPPYADTFSIEQHQLGPFKPIMEYYKTTHNETKKN